MTLPAPARTARRAVAGAAALLLTVAGAASAQDAPVRLTPGAAGLAGLQPQTTTLDVSAATPMGAQSLGTVAFAEAREGDRLVVATDLQLGAVGQVQQDTTTFALPSLATVSRVQVQTLPTPQTVRLDVVGDRLVGRASAGDETTEIDAALDGAFGPGATRLVVRSLPFADGYTATFDQVGDDGDRSTSTLRVTGREALARPDGTERDVWVVVEEEPDTPDYTYYVDAETRELLRMTFEAQPGVTVEMVAR